MGVWRYSSNYFNIIDKLDENDIYDVIFIVARFSFLDSIVQIIKNETKNMNELVSKLLYITRADTGKVHLKKTKINVQELINEVIEETK